jgi:hypothetical protein
VDGPSLTPNQGMVPGFASKRTNNAFFTICDSFPGYVFPYWYRSSAAHETS